MKWRAKGNQKSWDMTKQVCYNNWTSSTYYEPWTTTPMLQLPCNILTRSSGRPIFFPRINEISCRIKSWIISRYFFDRIFVRIEGSDRCFLKFLWIDILDESGSFLSSVGLPAHKWLREDIRAMFSHIKFLFAISINHYPGRMSITEKELDLIKYLEEFRLRPSKVSAELFYFTLTTPVWTNIQKVLFEWFDIYSELGSSELTTYDELRHLG